VHAESAKRGFSGDGVRRTRLTAQLLAGAPARSPEAVCERLLAVQGQDPRGFRLAVRARTAGLTAADVDRALNDRSLVVTWFNRGTLHLVRSDDYAWLHAVTAPQHETAIRRRLAQEGVADPERGVAAIEGALADEGPLAREALRDRVGEDGQALVHLLALASLRGIVVRGPMVGRQHAYALVRDWLGEQRPVDRDAALAELARRYLSGHGPAGDRDLARWAGIVLRDARAGLRGVRFTPRTPAPLPPPRLLGAFEPVLLGWDSREDVVGPHGERVTVSGIFRSFAMVGGRAVATWRLAGGELTIEPLEEIAPADAEALDADALDVRRFLGL
jgi:Winged helix DNA-binding domain